MSKETLEKSLGEQILDILKPTCDCGICTNKYHRLTRVNMRDRILALIASEQVSLKKESEERAKVIKDMLIHDVKMSDKMAKLVKALKDAREELCYLRDGFPINSRVHNAITEIDQALRGEGK